MYVCTYTFYVRCYVAMYVCMHNLPSMYIHILTWNACCMWSCLLNTYVHACTHLPPSVGSWWILGPKDHEVGVGLHRRLCLCDEELTVVIQHLAHHEGEPAEQSMSASQSIVGVTHYQEERAGARGHGTTLTHCTTRHALCSMDGIYYNEHCICTVLYIPMYVRIYVW